MARLEADGKLHLPLVYRGTKENTRKFVGAQRITLGGLYPPGEEGTEGDTEGESKIVGTEAVEKVDEEAIQGREPESITGSENGVK